MDLLQPLSVTNEYVDTYVQHIQTRSLEQLQDDLQMIWLCMPVNGYGDQKPMILTLWQTIIQEIKSREPMPWRERLVHRLPKSDSAN